MSRRTLLLPLLLAACFEEVWKEGSDKFPDTDSGGASGTSTTTLVPGGDASSGTQTVTSEPPTTLGTAEPSSTTTGALENEPPQIISLQLEPASLDQAGDAEVLAVVSSDVVKLRLEVDDEQVWTGKPAEFAWTFTATSKAASQGKHSFVLYAEDDEGLSAMKSTTLWVMLPETGAEKCEFEEPSHDGWLTATAYGADALIVAGTLVTSQLEATLWRLDPESCAPQAGFPRQISQWTALVEDWEPSQAVGVAIDDAGRTALAANIGDGLDRRPYVAVFAPDGELLGEHLGKEVGDTYSGITAVPDGFFVVGDTRVSTNPLRYDGLIEGFDAAGSKIWHDTIAAPLPGDDWNDQFNVFDEHPRAVVWSDDLDALIVVGERAVLEDKDPRQRAFSIQYTLKDGLVEAWTSSGLDAPQDGLVAVTVCGDEWVAGGWIQEDQNPRSPAARWLGPTGNGGAKRRLDPLKGATFHGLACDRENKFTTAASTGVNASVLGFRSSDDPFLFKQDFGQAALTAADCDSRGFCAVAGARGARAWVRVHHP
ncbi:hypothetical protein [Nannocystis bainbridge]|uniref:Uncharacterized protein n=1 Tax=Nannocystis bainbridge TaxID=2995303 RepID=A0ABT5DVZ1_9BACT|nr:hypothetical protein [Nannocystis bainbridge]MDC0717320.1 hypothetical protein [Nannocystis bainbridge]